MNRSLLIAPLALGLLTAFALPHSASAQASVPVEPTVAVSATSTASSTPLQVAGWIPYWKAYDGAHDAGAHLSVLDQIYPFAYSVDPDGRLKDLAGLTKSTWTKLFRDAEENGTEVIPTVMWSDTATIQEILSDPKARASHEHRILSMVDNGSFDGVDIDYEGKLPETRDAFSAFLSELKAGLGDKKLVCTIEARTPAATAATTTQYANDYAAIGKACDQVNLMTYDQQRADSALDTLRSGTPYYPVADTAWVKKVVENAEKDIPKDKIFLSIPTYGREVSVTVAPNWYKDYAPLWSVADTYATDTAATFGITPLRNAAGELSFSYVPTNSTTTLPAWVTAPAGTPSGNVAAARALAYATATGKAASFNLVWWSDAQAASDKVALAKELGIRGVSFFKIDGGEDMGIWDLFAAR